MAAEKDTIAKKDNSLLAKNILCAVSAGVLVQGAAGTANASSLPYIIVSPRYQAQAYDANADDVQAGEKGITGSTVIYEQAGAQTDEEPTAQAEQIESGAPVEMEQLESFDDETGQSRSAESKRAVGGNFSGQDVEAKNATMTFEPPKVIRPVEKRSSYEGGAGQSGIKARVAEILRLYDENKRSSPYTSFADRFQAKRHMHNGVINSDQAAKNEKSFWRNDGSGSIEENKDVEVDKSRSNVSGKSDRVQPDDAFAEPETSVPEERVEKAVLPQDLKSRAAIVQVLDEAPANSVSEPIDTGDDFEFKPIGGYSRYNISGGSQAEVSAAKPVQQRNPWAAIDAKKKAEAMRKADSSDIQRNTPVFGATDDDVASLDKMMMVERFRQPAPMWTHEVLQRLAAEGLLAPDDAGRSFDSLTRREGAVLTARSFNIYRVQRGHRANSDTMIPSQRNYLFAQHDIDRLMREFAVEVEALGYNIIDQVTDTKVVYKNEYDWKFGGELRYSFEKNSGAPRYTWSDHRLRGRIYADKAISPNWTVHSLLEVDKHNFFDKDDAAAVSDDDDGDLELSRIYLEGNYNWWNMPVTLELGKTYAYLAEGNVLDSDFDGLKITAKPDGNTIYSAGYGQVNDSEGMYYLEGSLRNRNQDYLGGYYHWDNYGLPTSIWTAGTNYYTGNYTLGGMYLKANRPDGSGADDGYVLSARYGKNFPWIAHTYEFDLKYYNMAGNTYINHTMNGVGNYMNGFEGWGAMAYYTPVENWVLGLEYYDLKDKTTDEKGKTLWASLSYSF